MIDAAQGVLLFVVVVLTILLVVLGVQIFLILKDVRKTIKKANNVLDDTQVITESVAGPVASISNFTAGIKLGGTILKALKGKKKILQRLANDLQDE